MPLLPLLQAVPLHIEAARNKINETITSSSSKFAQSTGHTHEDSSPKIQRTKRSSSSPELNESIASPLPAHKRARVSPIIDTESSQSQDVRPSPVLKTPLASNKAFTKSVAQLSRHSTLVYGLQDSGRSPLADTTNSSLFRCNTALPKTPRRPLNELFMLDRSHSRNQRPTQRPSINTNMGSTFPAPPRSVANEHPHSSPPNAPILGTALAKHPLHLLRLHSISADATSAPTASQAAPLTTRKPDHFYPPLPTTPIPALAAQDLLEPVKSPAPTSTEANITHNSTLLEPGTAGTHLFVRPVITRPVSRRQERISDATTTVPVPVHDLIASHNHVLKSHLTARPVPTRQAQEQEERLGPHHLSPALQFHPPEQETTAGAKLKTAVTTLPVGKLRERRSPFVSSGHGLLETLLRFCFSRNDQREGRRFIPLGDSDDDEDEGSYE